VPEAAIITEEVRAVDATATGDTLLVAPGRLPDALGWELKPQGLCRADACFPVRERDVLFVGDKVDLGAVAVALGRPAVIDPAARIAAFALDGEGRRSALESLQAPAFELDDLDGRRHNLEEWRGKKKLLVAFSSW